MGVICHATFFKPLVIKLQVCTSITASLLHFKSTVVGYRSKIIYTGSNSINTVDCIHQTSVCTKGYENMSSMWFIHWRSDSWVHQCKVLLSANSFFVCLGGFLYAAMKKEKKKKTHEKLTKHADILAFLPQKQDWSRRYWLRGKPHTLCKHSVRGHRNMSQLINQFSWPVGFFMLFSSISNICKRNIKIAKVPNFFCCFLQWLP